MEKDSDGTDSEYQENLNYLRQVDFFSGLPLEATKVFAYLCTRESYHTGEYLFQQNDESEQAYYIISGSAGLFLEANNNEQKVKEYSEGDFVGRLALLGNMRRLFSLKAQTDVSCLILTREKFSKALAQFPDVMPKMTKVIVDNVYNWEKRFMARRKEECSDCFKEIGVSLV
jgi:CRP-like cAMP-binding protein